MTLVLMAVGLLVTAAGLLTIGFGIPINAFSLGNTLIISGTIAAVGGLILIGLAAVLGQLRRIGDAAQKQSAGPSRRNEGSRHAFGAAARTGTAPDSTAVTRDDGRRTVACTGAAARARAAAGSRATLRIRAAVPSHRQ